MIQYEVPYNFDKALIPFYKKNSKHIRFVYVPPYKDDAPNTRTSIQTTTKGHCYMPQSRLEYEDSIREFSKSGLRFLVLWQVKDCISLSTLRYYLSLNASGFIVSNDINAELIKKYDSQLFVVCSIVQRTTANIIEKDLSYYDYVILYYPFNRALDALKALNPIKEKIILMPNTLCDVECPSVQHWFPTKQRPFIAERDCPLAKGNIAKSGLIFPEHLYLFDEHVGGYKLQGREFSTPSIKYICHFYFMRTYYEYFVDQFLSTEMASRIRNLVRNTPLNEYYNTKTQELISEFSKLGAVQNTHQNVHALSVQEMAKVARII